jgi:enamine deaminase RidA (YjgF/YER057c/UK114 family)
MLSQGNVSHSGFRSDRSGAEHFVLIQALDTLDFKDQVSYVQEQYNIVLQDQGLDTSSAVFRRIFLSDVLNQASIVRDSDLVDNSVSVSIVQQSPLQGSKIALLAYHIEGKQPIRKQRPSPRHLLVTQHGGQRHLWSTRLCTCDEETSNSSEKQTYEIFNNLIHTLQGYNANLRDHCVRTWLYMKDVDIFYKGMVDSRRELFTKQGLTEDTHYIASTGIQGACSHRFDLVSMDAYSNLDLIPAQVSYLNDFDYLCATKDYNVTFERGTRIAYADRVHLYISGTASIDKAGDILYPGDVMRQLERAMENVDVLLQSGGASLVDMMYLIAYLRDPADFNRVDKYFREHYPKLPVQIVLGSVCRPAWLIEVEGVAITGNNDTTLPNF